MPRRSRRMKVSKKLVSETKQAEDERSIVVLFADVVGCSEISNYKKIREYNIFINRFQECFKKVCKHYEEKEYKVNERLYFDYQPRGDEGCLKIFVPTRDDDLSKDIDIAINIALDLKREWLLEEDNRDRIKDGLLPIDLGIGIHSGKVFVNPNTEGETGGRPEGYAINLAKRIESESRTGKFSHIFVSESARQHLYKLKDEGTYKFDQAFTIRPKGISQHIKVFEIKHHFLPTDWNDVEMPSEVSMIYQKMREDKQNKLLNIAKKAHDINPTNLWLAEEYLLLIMMNGYGKYGEESEKPNPKALKEEYAKARDVAQRIAHSDLRDAGLLGIWGFIEGELEKYNEEQKRYKEALGLDEQDGDILWYLGYSMSTELEEEFDKAIQRNIEIEVFYHEIKKDSETQKRREIHKEKVYEILETYERAFELRPMNPWIAYDYARELSWWSQVEKGFRKKAIKMIIDAFNSNIKTKKWAIDDDYLEPIIDDPGVKKYIK